MEEIAIFSFLSSETILKKTHQPLSVKPQVSAVSSTLNLFVFRRTLYIQTTPIHLPFLRHVVYLIEEMLQTEQTYIDALTDVTEVRTPRVHELMNWVVASLIFPFWIPW